MDESFEDYDNGFRCGVFDKCNGSLKRTLTDGCIWDDGYSDGWDGNENKFPNLEPEPTGSTFDTDFGAMVEPKFFRLWVEWDYGQNYYVFETEEMAKVWLDSTTIFTDLGEVGLDCAQDLFDEGLAGLDIVTLIR